MSHDAATPIAPPPPPDTSELELPAARLPLSAGVIFGIAGLFSFLALQIAVLTGAFVWVVGSLFGLGLTGYEVTAAVASVPALYASWKVLAWTVEAERDPANQ